MSERRCAGSSPARLPVLLLALALTAGGVLGCNADPGGGAGKPGKSGKHTSRPVTGAPPTAATPVAAAPAQPPAPPLPPGARVFLDLSGSMQGFAQASPVALESVQRAVLQSLSAAAAVPAEYCLVGQGPGAKCKLDAEPNKYRAPSVFQGMRSNLASAIAPVPADAPPLPGGIRLVSPVDERRISVLITDGLEASEGVEPGQTASSSPVSWSGCLPGPDSSCLQRVLQARVQQGYGVWLVAISLPFKGRLFAERGLDKDLFGRTQLHLMQLLTDPSWTRVPLEAVELKRDPRNGNDSFRFTGARPLLLLLLSRDIPLGRTVTQAIVQELQSQQVPVPAGWLRSLELAPQTPSRYALHSVTRLGNDEAARGVVVGRLRRDAHGALIVPVECREGGAAALELAAVALTPASPTLPAQLQETLGMTLAAGPGLAARAATPPARSASRLGAYETRLNCLHFNAGETTLEYRLESGLNYQPAPGVGWWHEWNGPNTYEMPEKVYWLADLVEGILRLAVRTPQAHDRALVVVKKRG